MVRSPPGIPLCSSAISKGKCNCFGSKEGAVNYFQQNAIVSLWRRSFIKIESTVWSHDKKTSVHDYRKT
jgi:hypothetical protein